MITVLSNKPLAQLINNYAFDQLRWGINGCRCDKPLHAHDITISCERHFNAGTVSIGNSHRLGSIRQAGEIFLEHLLVPAETTCRYHNSVSGFVMKCLSKLAHS